MDSGFTREDLRRDTFLTCVCCRRGFNPRGDDDPWQGRMNAYCETCAETRCDAFPGACRELDTKQAATCPSFNETDRLRHALDWIANHATTLEEAQALARRTYGEHHSAHPVSAADAGLTARQWREQCERARDLLAAAEARAAEAEREWERVLEGIVHALSDHGTYNDLINRLHGLVRGAPDLPKHPQDKE